jgi:hypothetical protein
MVGHKGRQMSRQFNIVVVGQQGRLMYEAALFAASLREMDPGFAGDLFVAEPQPGPLWSRDPRIGNDSVRALLDELGATVLPFESRHFGESYPHGNKVEALLALPEDMPFVFFDSDTLVTGPVSDIPFDFDRPSASMRREGTWPVIELYGPGYAAIWRVLYDRFGLEFESTLDLTQPDEYWERYLYFNAGWFFHRSPRDFGARMVDIMLSIRDDPPTELACQPLDPWLDQVALPLAIHGFGGGRPGPELAPLDGSATCHYRALPLLYAREDDHAVGVLERVTAPNRVKKVLKQHEPFRRMLYQGKGAKARALFDRDSLPRREAQIRNRLRREGLWLR